MGHCSSAPAHADGGARAFFNARVLRAAESPETFQSFLSTRYEYIVGHSDGVPLPLETLSAEAASIGLPRSR